jgi:hypothetical protein
MAIVTEQQHIDNLVASAVSREREVYHYQVNIDNYLAMLAALPSGDWPAAIAQHAATPTDRLPAALTFEEVQQIADYQFRDRLRVLLRTEQVEQGKARRVLDAIKTQIPPEQYGDRLAVALAAEASR